MVQPLKDIWCFSNSLPPFLHKNVLLYVRPNIKYKWVFWCANPTLVGTLTAQKFMKNIQIWGFFPTHPYSQYSYQNDIFVDVVTDLRGFLCIFDPPPSLFGGEGEFFLYKSIKLSKGVNNYFWPPKLDAWVRPFPL